MQSPSGVRGKAPQRQRTFLKALIVVLLFLGLLGAMSAQWMDALVDACEVQQACIRRLQKTRTDWGNQQMRKVKRRSPAPSTPAPTTPPVVEPVEPLNLALLFAAETVSSFSPQERNWLLGVMGRLTAQMHPQRIDEQEAQALWQMAWQTLTAAREQGGASPGKEASGYTGRVASLQDLLVIPMDPQTRQRWCECLLAEQDVEPRLHLGDIVCIEPVTKTQPLSVIPAELVLAFVGLHGLQTLSKATPEQYGSILASSLEGWQLTALHRIISW